MTTEKTRDNLLALRDHFQKRHTEVLALTRSVVEAESPSGDEACSAKVVSLLAASARNIIGITSIDRIASESYGVHLRVRFGPLNRNPPLVLIGHTDTVHPLGSIDARPWRVEGNRIYGPGIFDMKANCVIALEALRACEALNCAPARPVTLLLTCDEENGSPAGRGLVEAETRRAHAALVLEPSASGGRVKTARKGTGMFRLTVHGRAAHAGLDPDKGASAVLEFARQTIRLHAMNDVTPGTTVTVGTVQGGTHSNVVPARAEGEIDVRFSEAEVGGWLENEILNLKPFDERTRVIVEGGINRPPLERTEKVASLYEHARSIAAVLNFDLGETSVGGASDGNFVGALGVPVLDGLGVQGDGAHAMHEHILADDIPVRGALLAGLIATL
jgi:glutamate carboxypeptidase